MFQKIPKAMFIDLEEQQEQENLEKFLRFTILYKKKDYR